MIYIYIYTQIDKQIDRYRYIYRQIDLDIARYGYDRTRYRCSQELMDSLKTKQNKLLD